MRNRLRLALLTLGTLAIAAAAAQASAQGWPIRPVTVVVPLQRAARPIRRRASLQWACRRRLVGSSSIENVGGACDVGTSRPSVFAVLRLIANSYLVGACTGRSAGFSPLRTRST